MASHIHLFKPGQAFTNEASAAITGGRLVEVTGPRRVAHAAAGSTKVLGAAATDAATGEDVLVLRGGVQNLVGSAAITAGAELEAAAAGKVVTKTTGARVGIALTTTTAADQTVTVALD